MSLQFSKYQGAGNDFILVDQRQKDYGLREEQIAWLCHRRFGIGADGLILLESSPDYDFRMVYFNADGRESTLCGNGGRCLAAFARRQGVPRSNGRFLAVDGPHEYDFDQEGRVHLQMPDLDSIEWGEGYAVLDTGSPHYVHWVDSEDSLKALDVEEKGREIRNRARFGPAGINVNFVFVRPDQGLILRTYERGVEAETLACGTGVTAAAIASVKEAEGYFEREVEARGGRLQVRFEKRGRQSVRRVVLIGPAEWVYDGQVEIPEPVPPLPC